jgi:hypothetical protein
MTLSNLIRKGGLSNIATATPATLVTQAASGRLTVAEVATVAVAKPPQPLAMALTDQEESALRAWLGFIEETDARIIDEVLQRCRADGDV